LKNGAWSAKAQNWKVLHVLGKRQWPTFQHEDAVLMGYIFREQVLGDDSAE